MSRLEFGTISSSRMPPSRWRQLRRGVARQLQRWPLPWPPRARVALGHSLSSELLLQAVGNLEARDEFFAVRKAAWAAAHRVLGIDASRDRFSDTGWEFALEAEVAGLLLRPLLVSADEDGREGRLLGWLNEFLSERWVDCLRDYQYMRRRERARHRRASRLRRAMLGREGGSVGARVLSAVSSAIHAAGAAQPKGVSLVVARSQSLALRRYAAVVARLRDAGVPVVWLAIDPEAEGSEVSVRHHPWGVEVHVPLPDPEEILAVHPGAGADYARLLGSLEAGFGRLPSRLRGLAASATRELPTLLYRWLAASSIAPSVFDAAPVTFVHVMVDKDVEARAFIAEARRRGIPSAYHYDSMEVGAPSFWPVSDRILVAGGARAGRLTHELGIAPWRIEAVGSLEVDAMLREFAAARAMREGGAVLRVALLAKWPAEWGCFGPPEDVLSLIEELPRSGRPWSCLFRPHPKDRFDYTPLERALPGRVQVTGRGYGDGTGMADTLASSDLVVSAMGNAVFCALAVGVPTIIYNPNPKVNLGHDRLLARRDLPRQVRLVERRGDLVQLLGRVILGQEPGLLVPEPLPPSLVRHLFYSLDGGTADRIASVIAGDQPT